MTTKKKNVIAGPVMVQPQAEEEIKEEPVEEQVDEPATTDDEVDEDVYREVEDKPIDKENLGYNPYDPSNTPQHKIPIKYKIWFFAVIALAVVLGYYLATSPTSIPVKVVPLELKPGDDGTSVVVALNDLEHVQVDVFKNNIEVKPRAMPTSDGWLYTDLEPGTYIFHITEVEPSVVVYGLQSITIADPVPDVSYSNITDFLKSEIANIPDEGNKREVCELLYSSFIEAAESDGALNDIEKTLRDRNATILGFTARKPKFNDESVWYDLLRENGKLYNYIKGQGIVISKDNYKQVLTAIAQGFKEST